MTGSPPSPQGLDFRNIFETPLRQFVPWLAMVFLVKGVLFAAIISFLEPINPDEQTRSMILTLIMTVVGIFAGAGLSLFTAYLNEQRRTRETP